MAKKYNFGTNSFEKSSGKGHGQGKSPSRGSRTQQVGVPWEAGDHEGDVNKPDYGNIPDKNAGYDESQLPTAADPSTDDKVLEGIESHLTSLAEAASNANPGDDGPANRLASFKQSLSGKLAR
jgi:hypothetical protein